MRTEVPAQCGPQHTPRQKPSFCAPGDTYSDSPCPGWKLSFMRMKHVTFSTALSGNPRLWFKLRELVGFDASNLKATKPWEATWWVLRNHICMKSQVGVQEDWGQSLFSLVLCQLTCLRCPQHYQGSLSPQNRPTDAQQREMLGSKSRALSTAFPHPTDSLWLTPCGCLLCAWNCTCLSSTLWELAECWLPAGHEQS